MKVIPIKIRNKKASLPCFVDDEDYEDLMTFNWHFQTGGYAFAWMPTHGLCGKKPATMHRAILWSPKGMCIDHIDGNGLNNQKKNLRVCTLSQNQRNRKKAKNNTSGYMGVMWCKRTNKWRSQITYNGKNYHIGLHTDLIEAAKAYDKRAKEIGEGFSTLNFPIEE